MPLLTASGDTGSSGSVLTPTLAHPKIASGNTGSSGTGRAFQRPAIASGKTGSSGAGLRIVAPFEPPFPVLPSTPVGVIPQSGSAIFTGWTAQRERSVVEQTHWDRHSTGRQRHVATRHRWDLHVECDETTAQSIWAFIVAHIGAGLTFFFYDLEQIGAIHDPTGVATLGRYECRFAEDVFPRRYRKGARYTFEYRIVEVE